MPFTPYHFGPGLLIKGIVPKQFSLVVFFGTQVLIDVETLYHLVRQERPVHRVLHTMLGAAAVGVVWGLAAYSVGRWLADRPAGKRPPGMRSGLTLQTALLSGFLGGTSHSLLDSLMHSDVRPYWPLLEGNMFLGATSLWNLHAGCVLAGFFGIVLWIGQSLWK